MILGYLDPVTSSAIFQVLLGALAAAGLGWQYVRKGWNTMLAKIRREPVEVELSQPESS
jgi:hypothetical protein